MSDILFDIKEIDEDIQTLKEMMDYCNNKKSKEKHWDRINKTLEKRMILMNERDGK